MAKLAPQERAKLKATGRPPANFMDALGKMLSGDSADMQDIMETYDEGCVEAAAKIKTIEMADGSVLTPPKGKS